MIDSKARCRNFGGGLSIFCYQSNLHSSKLCFSTKTNYMLKEFRDFIMRGNVLELAVAVIVAGAFGVVVASLTNDIILPPLGLALGGVDFSDLAIVLKEAAVNEAGEEVPAVAIRYGAFIQAIINFLIIAFIIFMLIRTYKQLTERKPESTEPAAPAAPTETEILIQIRDLLQRQQNPPRV